MINTQIEPVEIGHARVNSEILLDNAECINGW